MPKLMKKNRCLVAMLVLVGVLAPFVSYANVMIHLPGTPPMQANTEFADQQIMMENCHEQVGKLHSFADQCCDNLGDSLGDSTCDCQLTCGGAQSALPSQLSTLVIGQNVYKVLPPVHYLSLNLSPKSPPPTR